MDTYIVFIVQGYEAKVDNGQLLDSCEIQLIDETAENALKRAKELLPKSHYRISMIIEKIK